MKYMLEVKQTKRDDLNYGTDVSNTQINSTYAKSESKDALMNPSEKNSLNLYQFMHYI